MKQPIYGLLALFIFLTGCSGNSKKNDKVSQTDSVQSVGRLFMLPLGMKRLADIQFPPGWDNQPIDDQAPGFSLRNTRANDYNSLFYFADQFYNAFYDSLEAGGKVIPVKAVKFPFDETEGRSIDRSVRAAGTVRGDQNYELVLARDGGAFNGKQEEQKTVVNYALLLSMKGDQLIDQLLLFYTERDPVMAQKQFFVIGKDHRIQIFRFLSEETQTSYSGKQIYQIDERGKFRLLSNFKPQSPLKADLSRWRGVYTISVEGEATTTGTSATTWTIDISSPEVRVSSETVHEPILRNGTYRAEERNGQLELYYQGDEEACRKSIPNFIIKKEGSKYFVQGPFGVMNDGQWLELTRK